MITPLPAPAVVQLLERSRTVLEPAGRWLRQDRLEVLGAAVAAVLLYPVLCGLREPRKPAAWPRVDAGTSRPMLSRVARKTHGPFPPAVATHLVVNLALPRSAFASPLLRWQKGRSGGAN